MLTVHSDDLGKAGKALAQLSGSLNNPQPLMRGLATLLEHSTRKRFETKIAPDGEKWAAWADSTKQRYAAKVHRSRNKKRYLSHVKPRHPDRLLRDTSTLLRSLTRHATREMAQVGTAMDYAPHHQFGTKHMVARPIFGISAQDQADIADLLHDFVQKSWGN